MPTLASTSSCVSIPFPMREPVLNKLTADPHYRLILGQRESTISFDDLLNNNLTEREAVNDGTTSSHPYICAEIVATGHLPRWCRRSIAPTLWQQ